MVPRFSRILEVLIISVVITTFSEAGYTPSGREVLGIQTLKHELTLKPDYDTGNLEGISQITILNASQESITRVPLLLYHKLRVKSASASDDRTLKFTQRVVPLKGHEKMLVNYVDVALNEPMPPGATFTLRTRYGGELAGYVEAGNIYVKDHVNKEFTILRTDCLAYPIVGAPSMDDLLQSFYRDMRNGWDYFLEVSIPAELVAANGGKLIGRTSQNGVATYRYRNIKPAWRIDVCIAPYGVLHDEKTALNVFFLREHEEEAGAVLNACSKSLQFFSESFSPLPNFEDFTVIEVPDGYGSQTDVTSILQEAEAFRGNHPRLYHEVSHLWNPPSLDESPSRFESEGLAMFFEYWLPERLDKKTGQLLKGLTSCRSRFRRQCNDDPKYRDIPIANYGKHDCADASYTKGMIAFWLLYRLVGEKAFIDIYREFHQKYYRSGATLEDFTRTAESVSEKNLEKFFGEWIYGTESSGHLLKEMSFDQILNLYE